MTTRPEAETATPKVAITYLRVSTTRQMTAGADVDAEGNSIATQREWTSKKADALGAVVQREFIEPGASAQTIEKRPVFKELLAYLGEHPEVDYVIIYLRSRAFRNLGDAVTTKRKLDKLGVKLISSKEDFGEGIMADAMEAVTDIMNEVQVRLSGEDIKVKLRHKVEQGGSPGRAKLGYLNVRIEHDGRLVNSIGVDPERAPLVRQAFELYATGDYSLERLYTAMADLGMTTRPSRTFAKQPVSIAKLHRMLRDSYYIGIVTFKGEQFPGRHQPIVDRDLFEHVQQVMDHRSARGQRDRILYHYLKGLLFCDRCAAAGRNSRLIYTEAKGRGGTYGYYLCRGRQDGLCDLPYLPVRDVEDAVARHYQTLGLPKDFLDIIGDAIEQTMSSEQEGIRELHAGYRKKLVTLATREEKLLDLAEDGTLPRQRIRTRLRQVEIERQRAEQGLTETGDKIAEGARYIQQYIALLEQPEKFYASAPVDAKRDLNQASFRRLWIEEDGIRRDEKTPIVHELHEAAKAYAAHTAATVGTTALATEDRPTEHASAHTPRRTASTRNGAPDQKTKGAEPEPETYQLADFFRAGSSKQVLVPPTGLEPALERF